MSAGAMLADAPGGAGPAGSAAGLEAELHRVTQELAAVQQQRQEEFEYMKDAYTKVADMHQKQLVVFTENEAEMEEKTRRLAALEEALRDSEDIQQQQMEMLEEAEGTIEMLRSKASSVDKVGQDTRTEATELQTENLQLLARLSDTETELREQREVAEMAGELRGMLEALEKTNLDLRQQLADAQQQKRGKRESDSEGSGSGGSDSEGSDSGLSAPAEVAHLEAERNALREQVAFLEQQQQKFEAAVQVEMDALHAEKTALTAQIESLTSRNEELKSENERLRAEMAASESAPQPEDAAPEAGGEPAADRDLAERLPAGMAEAGRGSRRSADGPEESVEVPRMEFEEMAEEVEMLRLMKQSLEEDVQRVQSDADALAVELETLKAQGAQRAEAEAKRVRKLEQELEEAQRALLETAQTMGRSSSRAEELQEAAGSVLAASEASSDDVLRDVVDEVELVSLRDMQRQLAEALALYAEDGADAEPLNSSQDGGLGVGGAVLELLPKLRADRARLQALAATLTQALEAKSAEAEGLAEELKHRAVEIEELQASMLIHRNVELLQEAAPPEAASNAEAGAGLAKSGELAVESEKGGDGREALAARVAELEGLLEEKMAQETELALAKDQLPEAETLVAELEAKLAARVAELEGLLEEKTAQDTELTIAKDQLQETEALVAELEAKLAAAEGARSVVEGVDDNEALAARVAELEGLLEEKAAMLVALEAKLVVAAEGASHEVTQDRLSEEDKAALDTELARAKKQLKGIKARIVELQAKLAAVEAADEGADNAGSEASEDKATLDTELAIAQDQLQETEALVPELEARLAAAEAAELATNVAADKLTASKAQMQALESKLAASEEEAANLQAELQEKMQELESKLAASEEEAANLQAELQEKAQALADALARAAEQGVDVEEVEELKRQLQQQSHLAAHLEAELSQRGAGGFDSSMHSLQMSLHRLTESRISDTKATVLESKLRGASGKHAALAEELHAARTQVSELTLLQAQEVSARCEAEQLAELRKEEIEALVVEITDQCAEMSRLKGELLTQELAVQCEKERCEQLERALGVHKRKVESLEAVLEQHRRATAETSEIRQRLWDTARQLEEKERNLESIKQELAEGKRVWNDMNDVLRQGPTRKANSSSRKHSTANLYKPATFHVPEQYIVDGDDSPPLPRKAWNMPDDVAAPATPTMPKQKKFNRIRV